MRQLTDNARRVLEARYLRRDVSGRLVETPEVMLLRVARAVAAAETRWGTAAAAEQAFAASLTALEFLPNTPTLVQAGLPEGQLSACYVLPVGRDAPAMAETVRQTVTIQTSGGGTGFALSGLDPASEEAPDGPLAALLQLNAVTERVRQGGYRRGANMGVLSVNHPDIRAFIAAKADGGSCRNFNLSVGITDAFMQALEADGGHVLVHPHTGREVERLPARELWQSLVEQAWRTGDPGLVFLDAINRANPTPHLGRIEATNPCGEVPLLPGEACHLASINLLAVLRPGAAEVDWTALQRVTRLAVRFLDDVIDVNHYPFDAARRLTLGNRKIGLGVMGFADLLIELNLSYDSDAAVAFAERLMAFIQQEARQASRQLAEERGVYPHWPGSRHEEAGLRLRHATCTAIAPTGTLSLIAGVSPGIEPLFGLAFRRSQVLGGQTLSEVHPRFAEAAQRSAADPAALIAAVLQQGSLAGIDGAPAELHRRFLTAHEIPPERHLAMQAAFQRHVDNAVSKTLNLPQGASVAEVDGIYRRAWRLGLKGVTVFRHGCRDAQVIQPGLGDASAARRL